MKLFVILTILSAAIAIPLPPGSEGTGGGNSDGGETTGDTREEDPWSWTDRILDTIFGTRGSRERNQDDEDRLAENVADVGGEIYDDYFGINAVVLDVARKYTPVGLAGVGLTAATGLLLSPNPGLNFGGP
ncbi:hypothetical protein MMC22_011245 [Lobaria immixta]|nr:hypothetical protein [Lobaria immixta]